MFASDNLRNEIFGPVSFQLLKGQSMVIEGASGSGKSRFFRALADLDHAEGRVSLNGRGRDEMPAFEWRQLVRLVPATSYWWHDEVHAHFTDLKTLQEQMGALELPERLLAQKVVDLSNGEKQRLSLLRALQDRPPVLLLDEPTSALDTHTASLVEGVIDEQLAVGAILLIVSHSPSQRDRYGPSRLVFEEGRVVDSQLSEVHV